MSIAGRPVVRADARDKLSGRAVYGVDVTLPGMLQAAVLRSPLPAGRIRRLDLEAVRRAPGVRAVLGPDDVPDVRHGLVIHDQPLLARDEVRFEGEPIAVVAADTLGQAAAALALADLELEPLEAVVDLDAAVGDASRLVHEGAERYTLAVDPFPRAGNVAAELRSDPPGVDEAFARADLVVEDTFRADRQYQAYLEPRAVVAEHVAGRYTLHVAHQFPYAVRDRAAQVLGVPAEQVRVVGHHIGGGFGAKLDLGMEPHAALLARATGRPVRLCFSRPEDLLTCPSRENAVVRVRTGVSDAGELLAREVDVLMDAGAYAGDAPYLISLALHLGGAVYRIGPTRVRARAVYTNTTPTGAFRGVSGTYLVFAFERHLDRIARRLRLDRRELRMRNLMADGDRLLNGQVLGDASILRECFEAVERVAPWPTQRRARRGVGLAATVWLTNPLPGSAEVRLEDDGSVAVVTAATENGSGAVALGVTGIVAAELGVRPEAVHVSMPDTAVAGYDAGSQGSRTTHIVGRAARTAAAEVRDRVLDTAAELLEAAVSDLEIVEGAVGVRGSPGSHVPLAAVAAAAAAGGDGPIRAVGEYATPQPAYDPTCASGMLFPTMPTPTYHVHQAEVEVDEVTGAVTVLRYVVAQEVGRAIDRSGVLGQVQGGVAQGLGYALYESLSIAPDGRYRQRSLESYRLPVAPDIPDVEVVLLEHPDPAGPFGAKGVAEPPIVPVAAAIANAIADATGGEIDALPVTLEAVLDALEAGAALAV